MSNVLGKLAEKIGVVVQSGGTLNIENFNFQGSPQNSRPRSERLLLQQVQAEVSSRLSQSLHNQVFINLGKEEQLQQVKRPWDFEVKLGSQVNAKLDSDTTILDVFERDDIQGRLLILGKPGSGKTTTLLDLAQSLIKRASSNSDEPIPVLVGLSSWATKQQQIPEWLVEELKTKYGVRKDIGKQWLDGQKILPLFDGLDEVKSDSQKACIESLNRWIGCQTEASTPGQLVICSRIEEYELIETQLQMNGAICLTELSEKQIKEYLESIEKHHIWSSVRQNQTIQELVRAPLFLSMIIIADQVAPDGLQTVQGTDTAQTWLIDIYISEMLGRAKNYNRRQMRSWLIWISQQMEREQQTEFLVEKIQPSWLYSAKRKRIYQLLVMLSVGLTFGFGEGLILLLVDGLLEGFTVGLVDGITFGLIDGITFGLIVRLNDGLLGGLIFGMIFGLVGNISNGMSSGLTNAILFGLEFSLLARLNKGLIGGLTEIIPLESLSWSWQEAKRGMFGGVVFILFFMLLDLFVNPPEDMESIFMELSLVLIVGPFLGLFLSPIFSLLTGFVSYEVEEKIFINQGIVKSLQSGLIRFFTFGLIFGLFSWSIAGIRDGLVFGTTFGLVGALGKGLGVGVKHFVLRLVLSANGLSPWNYARFLTCCSNCLILQQVGGRFRFIHKQLQEHFAAMPLERS